MRRSNPKQTNSSYLLIADGESEKSYLTLLINHYKKNDKRIKVKPELGLKNFKEQYTYVEKNLEEYNKILWIIDFDAILKENNESNQKNQKLNDFKNCYQKACALKNEYPNLEIIVNNPCLEYWYFLHKNPTSTRYFESYKQLEPELRKIVITNRLFAQYEKKQVKDYCTIYEDLQPYLREIDFKKLKSFDIDTCENQGCSEMYKIWEHLGLNPKE